ncbi:acyltransferase [Methyloglobulus morosus KoM1]|uniref:Acyltransferase n=1 Tax=Methyloglobulus morosus KoM1 TaxID=1116472 RepID=V5C1Z1_9GAMM|nr:acyltransferase family protein [Methyloglobulus morosus]ESS74094.1 acyltransferase [Methyloglobulus morosus KoM1]
MRLFWLDNLKAFGVFLVVFGHLIPESYLKQYIYSFHVPLFFFISGFLFDRTKYSFKQYLRKKLNTLLVPYFCFAIFSYLFWFFVVRNFSISGKSLAVNSLKPLIGILYAVGSDSWRDILNPALWFLPCLFVVEVIFYFIKNKYFLLIFAVLGYFVAYSSFRLPWSVDVAQTAIIFYGIGYFYKDRWCTYKNLPFLLVLHLVFCFTNGRVDMNNMIYGNIFNFYIAAYSGILFWLIISKILGRNKICEYIGSNAIIFIGLIGTTWFVIRGGVYIISGVKLESLSVSSSIIASLLQIVLTIPAIFIINRWMPFILGKRKYAAG